MFDDEPIVPVTGPIDPENPPVFPGKVPRDIAILLRDQLQTMAEQVNPYLGHDHRAIAALLKAAEELTIVAFPKLNGYAEYTPEG
jgi:hypothetical protein